MTPLEVLRNLRARGATMVLRPDDTIHWRAPAGVLTEALVATMRAHKDALLTMLEWYEERAGILEYEAGLPRAEAERNAWTQMEERYQ